MAVYKCKQCGETVETRCAPKKCKTCGAEKDDIIKQAAPKDTKKGKE